MPTGPADIEADARRVRVIERYVLGETMREIAAAEGIGLGTVSRDVAAVRAAWQRETGHALGKWRDAQLARIDVIEAHATASYERSLTPREKTVVESKTGEKASETERVESEGQAGDAKFLRIMLDCVAERCKILGLYAPKRTDLTSGGEKIKVVAGIDLEKI